MKKFGISSRIFALLLALAMVVSAVPAGVWAATGDFASVGDTGLVGNINTSDTISWPIKIYDYLNDGMLFEYSSAEHKSQFDSYNAFMSNSVYAGGELMPEQDIIGYDFTINGGFQTTINASTGADSRGNKITGAYDKATFTNWWGSASSPFDSTKIQAGAGTGNEGKFKYMHITLKAGQSLRAMPITGFYFDNTGVKARDNVRYAVIVYRTNIANPSIKLSWSNQSRADTKNGGQILYAVDGTTDNGAYYPSTETKALTTNSTTWNYALIDMKDVMTEARWNATDYVYTFILDIIGMAAGGTDFLDISHVAYFDTEGKAQNYGRDATAFSNNPGEYLPDQVEKTTPYVSGEITAPEPETTVNNTLNFASGTGFSDNDTYGTWNAATSVKQGTTGREYVRITDNTTTTSIYEPITVFGGVSTEVAKANVQYVTIVYRTSGLANDAKIGFWIEGTGTKTGYGDNGTSTKLLTLPQSKVVEGKADETWMAFTYNLDWIELRDSTDYDKVTTVAKIGALLPVTSGGYIDIAYISYRNSAEAAAAFAEDAVIYMNNNTTVVTSTPSLGNGTWGINLVDTTKGNTVYSRWGSSRYDVLTSTRYTTTNEAYINLSDRTSSADTTRDVITVYADGKNSLKKSDARYISIVYRTHNLTSATIFARGFCGNSGNGSSTSSSYLYNTPSGSYSQAGRDFNVDPTVAASVKTLPESETQWVSFTYDMSALDADANYNQYAYLRNIYLVFSGFTDITQSMDIAYIDFYSSKEAADNFGIAAAAYMNSGAVAGQETAKEGNTYKHWNMGSNAGFTMLYPANGGGWFKDNIRGGANDWVNGYFNYNIGEYIISGSKLTFSWNESRVAAIKDGSYPVSNSIFTLHGYSDFDVSQLNGETTFTDRYSGYGSTSSTYDIGYTLYNTAVEGPYTVGLLESSLGKVVGTDGKTYKILQYKDDTIDYIAQLLQATLVIPEKDTYGNYNYTFIKGAKSSMYQYDLDGNGQILAKGTEVDGVKTTVEEINIDLATALRARLGIQFRSDWDVGRTSTERGSAASLTSEKRGQLIGSFQDCVQYIDSFAAAAYYLLHNLFVDNSYNQVQDEYNYLVLSKGTMDKGDDDSSNDREAYVFDAGFTTGGTSGSADYLDVSQSAVVYDTAAKTISLSSALAKDQVYFSGSETTSRFPFLPITDAVGDFAKDTDTYYAEGESDDINTEGAGYSNRNFNYVMQANGEFVYHYQDDLFFEFEGDDDVYLFINGELVLDIGAAHSITKVNFDMNNYVNAAQNKLLGVDGVGGLPGYKIGMSDAEFEELIAGMGSDEQEEWRRWHRLNLVDGQSYEIDFYYMERHGWGANMRIGTNIVMTDPALKTRKTAYQNNEEIPYGGLVDDTKLVEYSFSMTNEGNNKLYNLTFTDNDIGVSLDKTNGLVIADIDSTTTGIQTRVKDKDGGTLEASDLVVNLSGTKDGVAYSIDVTFKGDTKKDGTENQYMTPDEELKKFLEDLSSNDGTESGTTDTGLYAGSGLWKDATITIRGIYYELPDLSDATPKNTFNNKLSVTANPAVNSQTVIKGEDTHQVRVIADAIHIYQWAGNGIFVSRNLIHTESNGFSYTKTNADSTTTVTQYEIDQIMPETCRQNGDSFSYTGITLSQDKNHLLVQYEKTGTYTIFVKVRGDSDRDGQFDDLDGDGTVGSADYLDIVPLVIHVADVNDDVIVLDYGLKAELTGDNGIKANDYLTFADTTYSIMGLTTTTPSYLSYKNWIAFTNNDANRIDFSPEDTDKVLFDTDDGTFSYVSSNSEDDKLFFTPGTRGEFMDEENEVYVAVTVHKTDMTPNPVGTVNTGSSPATNYSVDITQEVQMYQKVTVLPANVVYYEDDFPAIKYTTADDDGNMTDVNENGAVNVFTRTGSSADKYQDVAQDTPYGSDPEYQKATNATESGGSLTTITIGDVDTIATFDFKGTGFEIIGQTNAKDAGIMVVTVKDSKGDVQKSIPVITEFDYYDNGEGGDEVVYQVPVIRVDDLTLGTYTVEISAVPNRNWNKDEWVCKFGITQAQLDEILADDGKAADKELLAWVASTENTFTDQDRLAVEYENGDTKGTYYKGSDRVERLLAHLGEFSAPVVESKLYIDGIRIFKPLGSANAYYGDENGAEIVEVRYLIQEGKVSFIQYDRDNGIRISTAYTTWTENRNGDYGISSGTAFQNNYVTSLDDYLTAGPNNEVYIRWTANSANVVEKQAIVFYVSENEGAANKTLQIGFRYVNRHDLRDTAYGNDNYTYLYWNRASGTSHYKRLGSVESGTEQYYEIDYTKCPKVEIADGVYAYEVVLHATQQIGSFTSLKYNGLTLHYDTMRASTDELTLEYQDGVLVEKNTVTGQTQVASVLNQRFENLASLMAMDIDEETDESDSTPEDGETGSTPEDGETGSTPEDGEMGSTPEDGETGSTSEGDQTGSTNEKDNTADSNKPSVETGDVSVIALVGLVVVMLGAILVLIKKMRLL